jgi:hypothetical protein
MSNEPQEPLRKRKKGLDFELLEEYRTEVVFDDDVDRYFNTDVVRFTANTRDNYTK